ncbi:MAG: hypothetical protein U0237_19755 [Thermoleophilia bacterium]
MALVVDLPTSNTNTKFAYARAEFLSDSGRRRVLVWQLNVGTGGRTGTLSLREGRGAQDLPGTRVLMSQDELMAICRQVEAVGHIMFGGHEIRFEEPLRTEFVTNCRRRLADAERGGAVTD